VADEEPGAGENGGLKRLVADLSLEKQVLKDIAQGNLQARMTQAGGGWHSREVWPLGAACLPDRLPTLRHQRYIMIVQVHEYRLMRAIVSCIPTRTIWLSPDQSLLVDAGRKVGL